jgi:lysophospholipase L1-like esterase
VRVRKLWLGLATAAISATLCGLVLTVAIFGHVLYCERTGRNVDPRLVRIGLVRRIFTRPAYDELVTHLQNGRRDAFPTVWDTELQIRLSKDLFVPTQMNHVLRYRLRPNLRVVNFRVFSGLTWLVYAAADSPALREILGRCTVWHEITFETDAHGFKKTDFPVEEGKPSVLFLGDSFTEGMHVASRDTFVNRYGHMLRRAGVDALPINGGVEGYGVLEESWTARRVALPLHARVIIVNLFLNDVCEDIGMVLGGEGVPQEFYRTMFRHLGYLERFCQQEGILLVVAVIPAREQIRLGESNTYFQERVARWCAKRNVEFLDPLPFFRNHGGEANYFSWDPHLNERGHRRYAAFLFRRTRAIVADAFRVSSSDRDTPQRAALAR